MTIDSTEFKAAMRNFAGHVCLITTTSRDGQRAGLTATAVCSVSAEPPTLLVCVNRGNASYEAIIGAGVFAVNVLALGDRPLADRFSTRLPGGEKFSAGSWTQLISAAPVLESALVGFDCKVAQWVVQGTHAILFGEIQAIRVDATNPTPLLYSDGSYGGFASVEMG